MAFDFNAYQAAKADRLAERQRAAQFWAGAIRSIGSTTTTALDEGGGNPATYTDGFANLFDLYGRWKGDDTILLDDPEAVRKRSAMNFGMIILVVVLVIIAVKVL